MYSVMQQFNIPVSIKLKILIDNF